MKGNDTDLSGYGLFVEETFSGMNDPYLRLLDPDSVSLG